MNLICLPGVPDDSYKVTLFCRHLGIEMLDPPNRNAPRIWTDNHPWKDVRRRVSDINGRMTDSRKPLLEGYVREAFGFGYAIDPTQHHGPAVEKWHAHARHGKVVQCPCKPKHNHFYSELLRGTEWRIAVFGDQFVCTHTQREIGPDGFPAERRIDGSSKYDVPWEHVFGKTEHQKMLALCCMLGVDYAEFDAIRNFDGRFCVIDCNPGPSSPSPHSFTEEEFARIIPTESRYFAELVNRAPLLQR